MEKFEVDGEIFIYHNGKYFDEHFCALSHDMLIKVMKLRLEQSDYKNFNENELLELIKNCKDNEIFGFAKSISEFGMKKYIDNNDFVKSVLPIFTSCCRKLNMPNDAIEKSKPYIKPSTYSTALNTSLAAAYCDVGDYLMAKKYADMAYAKLANLPYDMKREISNVYARIKAESKLID